MWSRNYLLARALRLLVTLWIVATAAFVMMRFSGDPVAAIVGPDPDPNAIEFVRQKWHLDGPVFEQYETYLLNIVRGDFGVSLASDMPAGELFLERVPATLLLGFSSFLLSIAIGMPLGIYAAVKQNTAIDRLVMSVSVYAFSMPNFFLGILLILLFSLHWHLLPSFGSGSFLSLIMPALTLGLSSAGVIARFARSSMLDVLNQPYIRAARARGIAHWRRTILHALPNASIPIVTVLGLRIGDLIAGAIIVETVFAWPGVGRLLVDSVEHRDLPVVQVIVLATAVTMVAANLTVDLLYGRLDPRTRR